VAGPAGLGAVGWVVWAAGWNCSGVCLVRAVKTKAVAPATTRALMIHASTSGRRVRRRGRFRPAGGGGGPIPPADGGRRPASAVSELSAEAVRAWRSAVEAGGAKLAPAVPVTAQADSDAQSDSDARSDPGARSDSGG
jgi:hypothetical protein